MPQKEETILTKLTPASLVKSVQFFVGMGVMVLPMWHFTSQWQDISKETLFEVKQLRKDYHRIEKQLNELTALANKHEKDNVKYEGKIEALEFRVMTLEKYHRHKKPH